MNEKRLGAWAASSEDPTEISNRVKGIVLGLSSVLVLLGTNFLGLNITSADIIDFASIAGAVAGAIWGLWGAGLALVRWVATVRA